MFNSICALYNGRHLLAKKLQKPRKLRSFCWVDYRLSPQTYKFDEIAVYNALSINIHYADCNLKKVSKICQNLLIFRHQSSSMIHNFNMNKKVVNGKKKKETTKEVVQRKITVHWHSDFYNFSSLSVITLLIAVFSASFFLFPSFLSPFIAFSFCAIQRDVWGESSELLAFYNSAIILLKTMTLNWALLRKRK